MTACGSQPTDQRRRARRAWSILALAFALASALAVGATAVAAQDLEQLRAELERLRQDVRALQAQSLATESAPSAQAALGRRIYLAACQVCHGINGDGRGPKARALRVRPRDFTSGVYKFRSTPYGTPPTDADLERVVRDGISGTEMVPFRDVLSAQQRAWVIAYIKSLSPVFSAPGAAAPGAQAVALPDQRPYPPSAEAIVQGRELFTAKGCSVCHGAEGDGAGVAAAGLRDVWGDRIQPWDFTRGYYKSGRTELDIFRTLTTGVGGTPMASYSALTTEQERWQLVDFVRSLARQRSGLWYALFVEEPTGVVYDTN